MGFVSNPSRDTYVLAHSRLDGSDLQVVKTFTDDFPQYARWSPDGQRVAFFSNKGGDNRVGAGIRVIHTDGSNEHPVSMGQPDAEMAWHGTRHELAFCRFNVGTISMLGYDVSVHDGYVLAVNTDTGAVTARPQADPVPPVYVNGSSHESVYYASPMWVDDTLLVNRYATELSQGRLLSAPGVVPAQYELLQRGLPLTVKQHRVSGGTYSPITTSTLAWDEAFLLDVNPATLEVMVWRPYVPESRTPGRLVLVLNNGSTQTLFTAPDGHFFTTDVNRAAGVPRFKWLPGGTQCLWERKLYNFDEFLDKGAAGATPLRTLGSAVLLDFFSV